MKKYRLVGIQIETGNKPEENIERLFSLFEDTIKSKPDFVVFPEMFEIVAKPENAIKFSHPIPSGITEKISQHAKRYSVNIIGGSFFERDGDRVYNTTVVFDKDGKICGKYRKMHLFDAFGYGESSAISRGDEPFMYDLDGLRFGVAICYDVRFPEIFRYYAVQGAQVVFVPSAFFQPNHDHWWLNVCSRALDNTIFVMACNQTGSRFVGRSMVCNPWGIPVVSMGIEEGYFTAEIDVDIIKGVREKLPFLENMQFKVSVK